MRSRGREHHAVKHQARLLRAAHQRATDPIGRQQTRPLDGQWRQVGKSAATGDIAVGRGDQRIEADGRRTRLERDRLLVGPLRPHLGRQVVERDTADALSRNSETAENCVHTSRSRGAIGPRCQMPGPAAWLTSIAWSPLPAKITAPTSWLLRNALNWPPASGIGATSYSALTIGQRSNSAGMGGANPVYPPAIRKLNAQSACHSIPSPSTRTEG